MDLGVKAGHPVAVLRQYFHIPDVEVLAMQPDPFDRLPDGDDDFDLPRKTGQLRQNLQPQRTALRNHLSRKRSLRYGLVFPECPGLFRRRPVAAGQTARKKGDQANQNK